LLVLFLLVNFAYAAIICLVLYVIWLLFKHHGKNELVHHCTSSSS